MRQLRGNRCLRFVISGKKENAGQKQSKQKTSRCVRLLSWGQRSVRGGGGVKNETKEPVGVYIVHTCTSIVQYILKTLYCSVIRK